MAIFNKKQVLQGVYNNRAVSLAVESGDSSSGGDSNVEVYSGTYEVTPSDEEQTLDTDNKLLEEDVVIKAIPCESVSNNFGGTTVTIG